MTLSWQPPSKDGGAPLTGYVIEKRDARRTQWVKAGSVDKDTTSFTASKLLEDNEYVFRVVAVNAEGESEPLESKDVAKPKQPLGKNFIGQNDLYYLMFSSCLVFVDIYYL